MGYYATHDVWGGMTMTMTCNTSRPEIRDGGRNRKSHYHHINAQNRLITTVTLFGAKPLPEANADLS